MDVGLPGAGPFAAASKHAVKEGFCVVLLIAAHLAAFAGGLAAKKVHFPAGAMVGAMLGVAVLNLAIGRAAVYPADLRAVVQICSGAIIGCRFTRDDVRQLRQVLASTLILVAALLGFTVAFAFLIARVSPLSPATALLACAPGGVSDLAILAPDFGADPRQVALIQLFRFVFVLTLFPPLVKRWYPHGAGTPGEAPAPAGAEGTPETPPPPKGRGEALGEAGLALGAAAAGGFLFRWLGVPAGAVIGSICATLLVNVLVRSLSLPRAARFIVQVCCGCFVGCQITREALASIGTLLLPMGLVVVEVLCMAFITSWLIGKLTKLDRPTALFSCIPGGIAEMSLLSEELGLDTPKIVAAHTCRIITVIVLMPLLIRLFL